MKTAKRQVVCVSAATSYYTAGVVYDVFENEVGAEYTIGRDGLNDFMGMTSSKFKPYGEVPQEKEEPKSPTIIRGK